MFRNALRNPRIVIPGALALLAIAATAALLVIASITDDGDAAEPLPPLTPFDPALAERLHAIRDRAAEIRELDIFEGIEEGWFTAEALQLYADRSFEDTREQFAQQLRADEALLTLLHLIPPDYDLTEALTSTGDIAGVYFYELDTLALVYGGGEIDPANELILAHEYTHSFQDGRWKLDKLDELRAEDDEERSNSEYAVTIPCVFEGDATLTQGFYGQEVYGDDWLEEVYGDVSALPEPDVTEELPPALARYASFNYNDCALFVAAIYAEDGWDAVNKLYENPPRSTEAILHPDRYLSDSDIGSIVPLPKLQDDLDGWERISLLPFGEFDVYVYLVTALENEASAKAAATGWDGGRAAVYVREGDDGEDDTLLHVALAFDTDQDLEEFLVAMRRVVGLIATEQADGEAGINWSEESAAGEAWWDSDMRRFDMIIGSDGDSVSEAAEAAGAPR